mmetsp:Transcript_39157/g.60986  ORF Transcript_39157/g.60986 Transcript_39157/m.60986 type:complete len:123 (-) Transcript_39157:33-401(-)
MTELTENRAMSRRQGIFFKTDTIAVHVVGFGGTLCSLSIGTHCLISEMKKLITQVTGIPSREQRLFVGMQELQCKHVLGKQISDADAAEVTLVRSRAFTADVFEVLSDKSEPGFDDQAMLHD